VNPAHLEAVTRAENMRRSGPYRKPYVTSLGKGAAFKTHCKRGHELSGANIYQYGNHRVCKACQRITIKNQPNRKYIPHPRNKKVKISSSKVYLRIGATHCAKGHEYTPENTRIQKNGCRLCITCKAEYMKLRRRGFS
jgi:hypothetical protein